MTTNNPEVVAWYTPTTRDTLPVVALNDRSPRGEPLIRLSDYERLQADHERLQAECEKLRKDAERYRWLMERGDDFQWENIIRLDIEDFPSRCAATDAAIDAAIEI